jgi:hypothetical protein
MPAQTGGKGTLIVKAMEAADDFSPGRLHRILRRLWIPQQPPGMRHQLAVPATDQVVQGLAAASPRRDDQKLI